MAVVNTYRVLYHFEVSGKSSTSQQQDYVQASSGSYSAIKAVLSSNSRLQSGTLVLDSVQEVGHGDVALA